MSKSAEYAVRVEGRQQDIMSFANKTNSNNLGFYITENLSSLLLGEPLYKNVLDNLRCFLIDIRVAKHDIPSHDLYVHILENEELLKEVIHFVHAEVEEIILRVEPWSFASEIALHALTVAVDWERVADELLLDILINAKGE